MKESDMTRFAFYKDLLVCGMQNLLTERAGD